MLELERKKLNNINDDCDKVLTGKDAHRECNGGKFGEGMEQY